MQRFETKYDLLNAAYKDSQLKKGTILLLQYLVHKSNKEQCFPAVETIAKALNVCKRTVQYNMRKLEKAGYIIRKDRWYNHQQLSNQYIFNFGITEDKPGKMRFTDEEYDTMNRVSFNNPDRNIRKISDIQKIYKMDLSQREKLLLIYLYHRANKKGVVYDLPEVFMDAVGIRRRSLMRLLHSLRDKGLLKIKYTIMHNREYFIMQLTGKVCEMPEEAVEDMQNAQKDVTDSNQEAENIIHNTQGKTLITSKKNPVACTYKKLRKILQDKWLGISFRTFMSNLKGRMISCMDKIRKILRI